MNNKSVNVLFQEESVYLKSYTKDSEVSTIWEISKENYDFLKNIADVEVHNGSRTIYIVNNRRFEVYDNDLVKEMLSKI